MADDHLSVGERGVATTLDAFGSEPVRVSGPGSGVPGRLGRVQALAAIGVVAALTTTLLMGLASPAGAVAGYGDVGERIWYTDAVQWSSTTESPTLQGPVSRRTLRCRVAKQRCGSTTWKTNPLPGIVIRSAT